MSAVPSPIETSLLQAAQAQRTASKARDRERASSDSAQRFTDLVELRVAGVVSSEALRKLPQNDSQEAGTEHESRGHATPDDQERPSPGIDVQA